MPRPPVFWRVVGSVATASLALLIGLAVLAPSELQLGVWAAGAVVGTVAVVMALTSREGEETDEEIEERSDRSLVTAEFPQYSREFRRLTAGQGTRAAANRAERAKAERARDEAEGRVPAPATARRRRTKHGPSSDTD